MSASSATGNELILFIGANAAEPATFRLLEIWRERDHAYSGGISRVQLGGVKEGEA